jgi:hypothetical protein
MLLFLAGFAAQFAIVLIIAFVLATTVPLMPNKVWRFVYLFLFAIPLNFAVNYVNVWAFGYHRMSRTGALIIAFVLAVYGTFCSHGHAVQICRNFGGRVAHSRGLAHPCHGFSLIRLPKPTLFANGAKEGCGNRFISYSILGGSHFSPWLPHPSRALCGRVRFRLSSFRQALRIPA